MKVWVTGAGGQLGRQLLALGARGWTRQELDVTDEHAVGQAMQTARPDVVVHAAAWTAVDAAETHSTQAFAVNRDGTRHVARAAHAVGAALIYVSTDYVFDGRDGPYAPDAMPAPLNVYGASKLAGEEEARQVPRHLILRTSWVCSPGSGFVAAILSRARRGESLRVVEDRGAPTPANALAEAILSSVDQLDGAWGTWHLCGHPHVSWHGFATALVEAAGLSVPVEATTSGDRAARRPADARLDASAFEDRFGVRIPWRRALPWLVTA